MWRNVSVLECVLDATRYCAEGTRCNDLRSLQILLGVEAPGSSEDTSFYSTKMGLQLMHFCPGIVVEIIRIGRQKISQKVTFIFYTNQGVRNP